MVPSQSATTSRSHVGLGGAAAPPDPIVSHVPGQGYRARRKAKKAQRSKLRRRATRSGISLVLLVVVVVGGSVGYLWYRFDSIARGSVNVTPVQKGIEDILRRGVGKMPAVASDWTDAQIDALVNYTKTLKKSSGS